MRSRQPENQRTNTTMKTRPSKLLQEHDTSTSSNTSKYIYSITIAISTKKNIYYLYISVTLLYT